MSAARRSAAPAKKQAPVAGPARPLPYADLSEVSYISSRENLRSSVGSEAGQQANSSAPVAVSPALPKKKEVPAAAAPAPAVEEWELEYDSGVEEPAPEVVLKEFLVSLAPAWPKARGGRWVPTKGRKMGAYGRAHFNNVLALFGQLAQVAALPEQYNAYCFKMWVRVAEVFRDFMDLHMGRFIKSTGMDRQQLAFRYQAAFGLVLARHDFTAPVARAPLHNCHATLKKIERLAYLLI